jgi:hypothetical protein
MFVTVTMNYAQVQEQNVPLAVNNSGISLAEDEKQGHWKRSPYRVVLISEASEVLGRGRSHLSWGHINGSKKGLGISHLLVHLS